MKHWIKAGLASVLLMVCIWAGNKRWEVAGSKLPPLGMFFNPATGFWRNAVAAEIPRHSQLILNTSQPVDVHLDSTGIPHIYAQNEEDAYKVQGYLVASNRLWQMDLMARATSGRLSEVVGEKALERDKLSRRKGLFESAKSISEVWAKHPNDFRLLSAYIEGVNSYIRSLTPANYPIEFKLIGYKPELWTPVHTALIFMAMSQDLCIQENDVENTLLKEYLGEDYLNLGFPESNSDDSPVIPGGTGFSKPSRVANNEIFEVPLGKHPVNTYQKPMPGIGSNNWAVAGSKTASGKPILCNDPHLGLTLPAIWFLNHIHVPQYSVMGVTFPGVPGVVIGFNENLAWGVTNGSHDVLDWYKVNWVDQKSGTYLLDGKKVVATRKIESYPLPDGRVMKDSFWVTHWGPVVHDKINEDRFGLAMKWIAHKPTGFSDFDAFHKLNSSKSKDDFFQGINNFGYPIQNFVFATREGDIGLQVNGFLPLRAKNQGRFVQDGSTTKADWQGIIPRSENPKVFNPTRGFVSSANQRSTDETYPYFYRSDQFDGNRGRWVNRRLDSMKNIGVKDMMVMQNDNYSLLAADALPVMLEKYSKIPGVDLNNKIYKSLQAWNYRYEKGSVEATQFSVWWKQFNDLLWDEILDAQAKGIELPVPYQWSCIQMLTKHPNSKIYDIAITPNKVETIQDILQLSFEKMSKDSDVLTGKSWDAHKGTHIDHLGQIAAFGTGPLMVGGFSQAINAIKEKGGPSWRMIVDLSGEQATGYGIYPGSNNGHPGSADFDKWVKPWMEGRYVPLRLFKPDYWTKSPYIHSSFTFKSK
jgi:penicillin G amidase